jgi:Holliday junction DNA helicase RuvA
MIAKLTGLLDAVGEDWAIVDVGGVGYLVYCSARTLANLPARGGAVSLMVETHVREDHIHLYGFESQKERDWFRLLNTVQGVGARVALGILSALPPDHLEQAIVAKDAAALTGAPGVGKKLASRLVSELADKIGGIAVGPTGPTPAAAAAPPAAGDNATADAVSALVNLGYGRTEAFGAVVRARSRLGDGAAIEALIRDGLAELGGEAHV